MAKMNDTQTIGKIEAQIEGLREDVTILKNDTKEMQNDFTEHKSKCVRQQCLLDHDVVTKMKINLETDDNILATVQEFNKETLNHKNEVNTNINMLTDKVAALIKSSDTRSKMKRDIFVGVAIAVIAAILVGGFTIIIESQKKRDIELKEIKDEVRTAMKVNMAELRATQAEIKTNQVELKKMNQVQIESIDK